MGEHNRIASLLNTSNPSPSPAPAPSPASNRPAPGSQNAPEPSPSPGPAPPQPSGGRSDGQAVFSPGRLRSLGTAMEKELEAIFRQARYKLNVKPRDAQPDAFTTFGFGCAMVYTEVIEYADQDLISKTELAMEFNDRLQKAASIQQEAERKSTINEGD